LGFVVFLFGLVVFGLVGVVGFVLFWCLVVGGLFFVWVWWLVVVLVVGLGVFGFLFVVLFVLFLVLGLGVFFGRFSDDREDGYVAASDSRREGQAVGF
jgi:hypothetical protein